MVQSTNFGMYGGCNDSSEAAMSTEGSQFTCCFGFHAAFAKSCHSNPTTHHAHSGVAIFAAKVSTLVDTTIEGV
jgi:hypothetical protein